MDRIEETGDSDEEKSERKALSLSLILYARQGAQAGARVKEKRFHPLDIIRAPKRADRSEYENWNGI